MKLSLHELKSRLWLSWFKSIDSVYCDITKCNNTRYLTVICSALHDNVDKYYLQIVAIKKAYIKGQRAVLFINDALKAA